MLAGQVAQKYAQAICQLAAEKGMLEEVEKQLKVVEDTIAGHSDMANLFYHPRVPGAVKKDTVTKIFGDDLSDFVRNFLLLLVDKRRELALVPIIREYVNLANEARNIQVADVTTAMPLSDVQRAALASKLSALTGKNVVLRTRLDQRIISGVVVKMGDKLIDGSVARQLAALKAALTKTEVTKIGVTS